MTPSMDGLKRRYAKAEVALAASVRAVEQASKKRLSAFAGHAAARAV